MQTGVVTPSLLRTLYGPYQRTKGGRELLFHCPRCPKGSKPKLYINARTGRGFCQRCHLSVDASKGSGGIDVFSTRLSEVHAEASLQAPRTNVGLPREAVPLYPSNAVLDAFHERERGAALDYFYKRGFDDSDLVKYDIHFCAVGKYQGRIVIPITYKGTPYSFIARNYRPVDVNGLKVLTPNRSTHPEEGLAHCGLDLTLASGTKTVVLVEGPFDAMAVGSPPGVALHGTNLPDAFMSLLLRKFDAFVLCLDPDGPGQTWMRDLQSKFLAAGKRVVTVRGLSDDPAGMGKERIRPIIQKAISTLGATAFL